MRLLLHEERLEVVKLLRHLHALLCAFHEGSETLWYLHLCADGILYHVLKLGRVGCLAKHAVLIRLELLLQSLVAAGAVGSRM